MPSRPTAHTTWCTLFVSSGPSRFSALQMLPLCHLRTVRLDMYMYAPNGENDVTITVKCSSASVPVLRMWPMHVHWRKIPASLVLLNIVGLCLVSRLSGKRIVSKSRQPVLVTVSHKCSNTNASTYNVHKTSESAQLQACEVNWERHPELCTAESPRYAHNGDIWTTSGVHTGFCWSIDDADVQVRLTHIVSYFSRRAVHSGVSVCFDRDGYSTSWFVLIQQKVYLLAVVPNTLYQAKGMPSSASTRNALHHPARYEEGQVFNNIGPCLYSNPRIIR